MQVKNIAECYSAIISTFIKLPFVIKTFVCLFLSGRLRQVLLYQGSHRLEKYLNLEGSLEKSLKIRFALKSTRKSFKSLEKSLNSTIFCRT